MGPVSRILCVVTPVETAARVLPGSVVGVSPKPADGNSSSPAGVSSVRDDSVPLDPGTSAMPCKVEPEPLLESDGVPEDPVVPVNFRSVAGGLVPVVLRAMDQQGHLGVSTALPDETRAQCPEAAENHLSITLVPLVLQALALNRDARRAFRRWSRKGNVAFPKGSYVRTCEGPALRPWNFRAGWNFGFWGLVSEIVDRFVSQRRPVSEGAFLSSLAELLLQTNPDPVIPNLVVTTLYVVKHAPRIWPLIFSYA